MHDKYPILTFADDEITWKRAFENSNPITIETLGMNGNRVFTNKIFFFWQELSTFPIPFQFAKILK